MQRDDGDVEHVNDAGVGTCDMAAVDVHDAAWLVQVASAWVV